jgi:transposase
MTRKPYPTDLTDAQWERLEPLLPKSKSGTRKGGRPPVDRREVVHGIFYHLRAGGAWELLPHDFPHVKTVFHDFALWRKTGLWERIHDRLREDVRVEAGHPPQPETGRIDSQTVKTTRVRGDRGYDGGKKNRRAEAVPPDGFARPDLGVVGDDGGRAGPGRRAVAAQPVPTPADAVAGGHRR